MKKKFKDVLLTFLIMVIIGILVFFNYYYYKLAPQMLNENQDIEILNEFAKNNNLNDLSLGSRYAFEEVFYSATDSNYIYIFDEGTNVLFKINKDKLDYSKVKSIATDLLNTTEHKIKLSILEENPVYVIVSKDYDIMLDFYTYKEIFRYRKGIVDE